MASSSSATSSTSSDQASADSTPPSRSTSYVELESLRDTATAEKADAAYGVTDAAYGVTDAAYGVKGVTHGATDTAYGVMDAAYGVTAAAVHHDATTTTTTQGRTLPTNVTFAQIASSPRTSPTPRPRTSRTSPVPTATSTPGHDEQHPPTAPPRAKGYPPLIVDKLPNWTKHFEKLHKCLGFAPNGRPFGQGVRFIPQSPEEYRIIQRYLIEATQADATVQWYCYSAPAEKPTKVAVRGLPPDTDPEEIGRALEALNFHVQNVRHIPGTRGRPGCLFHVTLGHLDQEELARLYATNQLLYMPGVVIEAWRGQHIVAQCHRCLKFGHASKNCFRPARCLRCAGEHLVADCPHPREHQKCANCGRAHAASFRRCPVLLKEQRKKRALHPPPPPTARSGQPAGNRPQRPTRAERRRAQAPLPPEPSPAPDRGCDTQTTPRPQGVAPHMRAQTTLAPPANDPTPRNAPPRKRKPHRGGRKHRKGPKPDHRGEAEQAGHSTVPRKPATLPRETVPPTQPTPATKGCPHCGNQEPDRGTQPGSNLTNLTSQPQRAPRSRTRRTPAPPAPTNAEETSARDPLQIILQRLDRMEVFCGALTDLISTIATGGDLKMVAMRNLARLESV